MLPNPSEPSNHSAIIAKSVRDSINACTFGVSFSAVLVGVTQVFFVAIRVGYGNMPESTTPRLAPYDNIAFLRCIVSIILDFLPMRTPIFAPQGESVAKHWNIPTAKGRIFAYPIYTLIAICIVIVDTLSIPFTNYIVVPDTRRVRCIRRIHWNNVNPAHEPWVCNISIKKSTITPILAPRILKFYDIFSFFLGELYRNEVVSCGPSIRLVRINWLVRITEFDKVIFIDSAPYGCPCDNGDTTANECRHLVRLYLFESVGNALISIESEYMSRIRKRGTKYLQFLVYGVKINILPHFLQGSKPCIAGTLRRLSLVEYSHIIFRYY